MLRSNLCGCNDANILVEGAIIVSGKNAYACDKHLILTNCTTFTSSICEITQQTSRWWPIYYLEITNI